MGKLYLKLGLTSLPVLLLMGLYFFTDPFQVLYHRDSYLPKDGVQYVSVNKDFVSTQMFLNNYDQYKYDSYIFGDSRSMYYHIDEWKKHISGGNCYHFDAYGEVLYGIERKFQLLKQKNVRIKNALIIITPATCLVTDNEKYRLRKHPDLTGQSWLSFQLDNLKDFFSSSFVTQYLQLLATGKVDPKPYDNQLNIIPTHYEAKTNELTFPKFETDIERNSDSFYLARQHFFYKRPLNETISEQVIKEDQVALFTNIRNILINNHTSFRIVISPTYNQIKINTLDIEFLRQLFGKENVWDFSGKNDITEDKHNYYEDSHYRPFIANRIMDSIYQTQP